MIVSFPFILSTKLHTALQGFFLLATMSSLFIVLFSTNCVHQTVTSSTERNQTRLFYCLHNTSSLKTIVMAQIHVCFIATIRHRGLKKGIVDLKRGKCVFYCYSNTSGVKTFSVRTYLISKLICYTGFII